MESDNLRTASVYINNLLLSRGLLRNGQAIEFATPEKGEGGVEATMGRIMRVVNDLVLRRDRDSEQRESLSNTLRTIRADSLRQSTDFERLQNKHTESQRKLGLAEATERALKNQIRSAEQVARGLREEMARLKVLVGQTRAQCANEARKRDRVIDGLKKHVADGGRARGSGKAVGVAVVNVVAGVGSEEGGNAQALSLQESGYDLRTETNEFLTELVRGLSEENENLGGLIRGTVETLTAISGWVKEGRQEGGLVVQMDAGYEDMAADIEGILEHLRTLLTNPSFVPLEEVEVREEEIIRLREGWEKMEGRWREAVQLMDGWRKRMAKSGQTVNLEELKMGMRLSPVKVPGTEEAIDEQEEGDTQGDIDAMDDSHVPVGLETMPELDEESEASDFYEEEGAAIEEPEPNITVLSTSSGPGTPPQLSPLRSHPNIGNANRRKEFTTIVEEDTWDLAHLDHSSSKQGQEQENAPPEEDQDAISLLKTSSAASSIPSTSASPHKPKLSPTKPSSRLPRPAHSTIPQQSPLTMASIAAKLAATEREADAARVRAKLKAAKLTAGTVLKPPTAAAATGGEGKDPMKDVAAPSPSKKRKASGRSQGGRSSRRRSTLSPWELESLILGGAGVGVTPGR